MMDTINTTIVYNENITIFPVKIISKLLFSIPFIIFKQLSNGNISHTFAKKPPTDSLGKYIPLVKHTSWTTMLPIPPVPLSLTKLPIRIPSAINNIETIIEISIVNIIFILKDNPNKQATTKNSIS